MKTFGYTCNLPTKGGLLVSDYEEWTVILPDGTELKRPSRRRAWRFAMHLIAYKSATHVLESPKTRTIKLEKRVNASPVQV